MSQTTIAPVRHSESDRETVLIFGATGRHGGTGARVIGRLQQQGRLIRAVVRSDDERAARLRGSGVQVMVGDLHDRRTLAPALDGVSSVYVAYPVAAGAAIALANLASAIHELGSSPHVVINSHGGVALNSPSGISREFAVGEELLIRLGVNVTVLRGSAFFYQNVLLAHSATIRETGVFANCFGDSRPAWISATDAADLCAVALLEPQAYAGTPIVYTPGYERLSQQEIADIISEETGRDVRYEYITPAEWSRQLKAAAARSGGLVNDAMTQHLPAQAKMVADNTTVAPMDVDPSALAAASGRPPLSFRDFVRQHRSAFGAATAKVRAAP